MSSVILHKTTHMWIKLLRNIFLSDAMLNVEASQLFRKKKTMSKTTVYLVPAILSRESHMTSIMSCD